jgi:hypothetical protein
LWTSVEQLARRTQVLVGFEQTPDCRLAPSALRAGDSGLDLTGLTAREAFDRLIIADPRYRWQEVGQLVVIRPVAAWIDPTNLLNREVRPFKVENAHVHTVLHELLQAAMPSLFIPHTDLQLSSNGRPDNPRPPAWIDTPVSLAYRGGTLLEALGILAKAHGRLIWQVGYDRGHSVIELQTLEFSGGSTSIPAITTPPIASVSGVGKGTRRNR